MGKKHLKTIMRAEVRADCYTGETCDQVRNYFNLYGDGDKESDDSREDLHIRLADLPAGAVVLVQYPCCPKCGIPREDKFERVGNGPQHIVGHAAKCGFCGFDWDGWVLDEYS